MTWLRLEPNFYSVISVAKLSLGVSVCWRWLERGFWICSKNSAKLVECLYVSPRWKVSSRRNVWYPRAVFWNGTTSLWYGPDRWLIFHFFNLFLSKHLRSNKNCLIDRCTFPVSLRKKKKEKKRKWNVRSKKLHISRAYFNCHLTISRSRGNK